MTRPPSLVRRTPWPDSASRAVATPLQPSVVYASESPDALDAQYEGRTGGYTYAREGHPNADVLARKIDGMEGISGGIMTGSGMSAVLAALLAVLKTGDHVVAADQLYGRSLRLLTEDLPRFGITAGFADPTDSARIAQAVRPETRVILVEAVSNPTLRVADMKGIAGIAREKGLTLIVDNTFTTPRAFRPFELGADIVVHSVTKLLAGHSDVTLGYLAARDPAVNEAARTLSVTWGLTASPFDCWLAERGLYSFDLRHDRAEANARILAGHLSALPGVTRVLHPSRPDHPDHVRAADLFGERCGNMVSFEIGGGRAAANRFVRAAGNIAFAPTLGDVGTTLSHPVSSSHRFLSAEAQKAIGINEGFFRVSVGIEDTALLCEEFEAAIRNCSA